MKKFLILVLCSVSLCFADKILTIKKGLPCDTVINGYNECHGISVKYNLTEGRIFIHTENLLDTNKLLDINLFDKDSLIINVISNLNPGHYYFGDDYKINGKTLKQVNYITVTSSDDEYLFFKQEPKCFGKDILWHKDDLDKKKYLNTTFICLQKDSLLNDYYFTIWYDYEIRTKAIYKNSLNIETSRIIDTTLVDEFYGFTTKKISEKGKINLVEIDQADTNIIGVIIKRYKEKTDNSGCNDDSSGYKYDYDTGNCFKILKEYKEYKCKDDFKYDYSTNECYKVKKKDQ